MRARYRSFLLAAAALGLFAVTGFSSTVSLIKTHPLTKQQYLQIGRAGFDVLDADGQSLLIAVSPANKGELESMGIGYETVREDLSAFYRSRYTDKEAATMGGFRTLPEIEAYLDSLSAANPTLVTPKFSIGLSIEGRNQWVVKISDNPLVDEAEPEIFYNSLIHAREPAGAAALMTFMEYLLDNYGSDTEVTDVVDNRELYFLLVTNPDGYAYNEATDPSGGGMWRKNRRNNLNGPTPDYGVDLNRNYGYLWGMDDDGSSPDPSDQTYRGSSPFSEPETQSLRDFAAARDFVIVHNIHTYSNLVLWPWGYETGAYTDREEFFRVVGDSMTQYNGYAPSTGWGLYPTNGAADDWFWGDTITKPRMISLTTEIGGDDDGFWPSPARIPILVAENIYPNMFLARIADNPYKLAPPKMPVITLADSVTQDFDVFWSVDDQDNPPVSYQLTEYSDRQQVADDAENDYGFWATNQMSLSSTRAAAGSFSWHSGNTNSTDHSLEGNAPYPVGANDSLKFSLWYDIESDWDYLYVQVSTDGGQSFTNLPGNLTTSTNPNGTNHGNGITGASGSFVIAAFDLSAYVGQEVLFRFSYVTDGFVLGEGVYLDNILNVATFLSTVDLGTAITDTAFAFSNKSAGQYWYRVQALDAEGQLSSWSDYATTTVYQDFVVGDCTGDGTISLTDVTCAVSYLFLEGTAPSPPARIDVNCSGSENLTDLTLMVNHLFVTFEPFPCGR
jgi:hypothetical protein